MGGPKGIRFPAGTASVDRTHYRFWQKRDAAGSRNLPEPLATILAHCLSLARRDFADLANRFREECWHVLQQLAILYAVDQQAKDEQLSPEDRLTLHQERSGPVMRALKE